MRIDCRLPAEPVCVEADAGQVRQVVLNLLLNALQSMSGGGRIAVTVTPWPALRASDSLRWVEVRIADTGPGIPPDELRRVFDPFYTTKRDGTGLGLAICHGLIEQHEGEIRMESEMGAGTTVSIRLPRTGE